VILRNGAPNTAKEIALDLKLPHRISAHTESMACASGLKAVISAVSMIETGNADVVIAGGSDSTSCTEMALSREVTQSLALYSFGKIGVGKLFSVAGLPCGWMPKRPAVTERSTGKTMGYHADVMSALCGAGKADQEKLTMASHANAAAAAAKGLFDDEVVPVTTRATALQPAVTVKKDTMVRGKQDAAKMASLKPVFRTAAEGGTITAATASPLTDGAAAVLVMSAEKAKALGYATDVGLRSWAASGINPNPNLLLAPAIAIPVALRRAGLTLDQIDFFEIHEAFAGQVLATINVLASDEMCKKFLGLQGAVGSIPREKLNIYGGSVSIGHPFGATGARIVCNAARILRKNPGAKYVLISICAAGGLGLVAVIEHLL
jgi:acetyl-CoA acyltransferase